MSTKSRMLVADSTTLSDTLKVRRDRVLTKDRFSCKSLCSSNTQLIWFTIHGSAVFFCEGGCLMIVWSFNFSTRSFVLFWFFISSFSFSAPTLPDAWIAFSILSPKANDIGSREIYCILFGRGRLNMMIWIVEARAQDICGTFNPSLVVAWICKWSTSNEGEFASPRTYKEDCPHSSYILSME